MSLRQQIISTMRDYEESQKKTFPNYERMAFGWYCTWWFKFKIPLETKVIRRELEKMERDGIVISQKYQKNNTRWLLSDSGQREVNGQ